MTRLTDDDIQALLSGELDAPDIPGFLDDASRADLDAYRAVWSALETEPEPFAPGFADRVTAAVEAKRKPASPRVSAWPLASGLAAVALLVFQNTLTATFSDIAPTAALPWLAAALLALAIADLADGALRQRAASWKGAERGTPAA